MGEAPDGSDQLPETPEELQARIDAAIAFAVQHGVVVGDHHKAWVIDQMVRILAGDKYEHIVKEAKDGEDGPDTYDWDEGLSP